MASTTFIPGTIIASAWLNDVNQTTYVTVPSIAASGGGLLANTVGSSQIVDGAVGSAELAASGVITTKIADGNVTAIKLAADSVTTVKILDANVTTAKLANGSVTAIKLDVGSSTGTGAATLPAGTSAQRPSASVGAVRYNSSTNQFEGYVAAGWSGLGGGQAGGVLYENTTTISSNYTLTTGRNAMAVGPITVATGVTLTIPTGQRLVIL